MIFCTAKSFQGRHSQSTDTLHITLLADVCQPLKPDCLKVHLHNTMTGGEDIVAFGLHAAHAPGTWQPLVTSMRYFDKLLTGGDIVIRTFKACHF